MKIKNSAVIVLLVLLLHLMSGDVLASGSPCVQSFEYGMQLQRSGNYAASIPYFIEATRACPDAGFYHHLAHSYQELRKWKDAERAFSSAISMSPDDGHHRFCRGVLYYFMDRYDSSLEDLKFALSRTLEKERQHRAFYFMGLDHFQKHQFTQAASAIEKAIDICGNCGDHSGYQLQLADVQNRLRGQERRIGLADDERTRRTRPKTDSVPGAHSADETKEKEAAQRLQDLRLQLAEISTIAEKQRQDQHQAESSIQELRRQSEDAAKVLEKQRREQSRAEQHLQELRRQQEETVRTIDIQEQQQEQAEQRKHAQAIAYHQESLQYKREGKLEEARQSLSRALALKQDDPELKAEYEIIVRLQRENDLTIGQVIEEQCHRAWQFAVRYRDQIAYGMIVALGIIVLLVMWAGCRLISPRIRNRRRINSLLRHAYSEIDRELKESQASLDEISAEALKERLRTGVREYMSKAKTTSILESEEQLLNLIRSMAKQFSQNEERNSSEHEGKHASQYQGRKVQ